MNVNTFACRINISSETYVIFRNPVRTLYFKVNSIQPNKFNFVKKIHLKYFKSAINPIQKYILFCVIIQHFNIALQLQTASKIVFYKIIFFLIPPAAKMNSKKCNILNLKFSLNTLSNR